MQRWQQVAQAAGLGAAGAPVRPTIFAQMTELATRTGALNLGQGFPDTGPPPSVAAAAQKAISDGANQYPPGRGVPALRTAIAAHQERHYGLHLDPDTQIAVTHGATEAIAAAVLALCGPGDEVVTLEPFYDSYAAVIAMAGARHVGVPLVAGQEGFGVDLQALRQAFSARTALVLLNTPHNPTGAVLRDAELQEIADLAQEYDATVVTDEVYEHLTYDGLSHRPIATLEGMAERTLTISSAGKSFSVTGWKVGWASGSAHLIDALVSIKQFLTYAGAAPLQPAVAAALDLEVGQGADHPWLGRLRADLQERRDLLLAGLGRAGLATVRPQGSYFVIADAAPLLHRLSVTDGEEFCRQLPGRIGVAAVPVSAFTHPGSAADQALRTCVRFTFVKSASVITEAMDRLGRLSGS